MTQEPVWLSMLMLAALMMLPVIVALGYCVIKTFELYGGQKVRGGGRK